jgi:hypothetical protein
MWCLSAWICPSVSASLRGTSRSSASLISLSSPRWTSSCRSRRSSGAGASAIYCGASPPHANSARP